MSLWSLFNSQSLQEVFEEADGMPHISIPIDDIIIIPKFPTFKPANENSGLFMETRGNILSLTTTTCYTTPFFLMTMAGGFFAPDEGIVF